jgi:hypothetical protein
MTFRIVQNPVSKEFRIEFTAERNTLPELEVWGPYSAKGWTYRSLDTCRKDLDQILNQQKVKNAWATPIEVEIY